MRIHTDCKDPCVFKYAVAYVDKGVDIICIVFCLFLRRKLAIIFIIRLLLCVKITKGCVVARQERRRLLFIAYKTVAADAHNKFSCAA